MKPSWTHFYAFSSWHSDHNGHLLNLVQTLYWSVQTSHAVFTVKSLLFLNSPSGCFQPLMLMPLSLYFVYSDCECLSFPSMYEFSSWTCSFLRTENKHYHLVPKHIEHCDHKSSITMSCIFPSCDYLYRETTLVILPYNKIRPWKTTLWFLIFIHTSGKDTWKVSFRGYRILLPVTLHAQHHLLPLLYRRNVWCNLGQTDLGAFLRRQLNVKNKTDAQNCFPKAE